MNMVTILRLQSLLLIQPTVSSQKVLLEPWQVQVRGRAHWLFFDLLTTMQLDKSLSRNWNILQCVQLYQQDRWQFRFGTESVMLMVELLISLQVVFADDTVEIQALGGSHMNTRVDLPIFFQAVVLHEFLASNWIVENMHYSVVDVMSILYCITDGHTILLLVTWQRKRIIIRRQTCSFVLQIGETVMLLVTSVHVLFICYHNGVVKNLFLLLVLYHSVAYDDKWAKERPSKCYVQRHAGPTTLKSQTSTYEIHTKLLSKAEQTICISWCSFLYLKLIKYIRHYDAATISSEAQVQMASACFALRNPCQTKPKIYMGCCTSSTGVKVKLKLSVYNTQCCSFCTETDTGSLIAIVGIQAQLKCGEVLWTHWCCNLEIVLSAMLIAISGGIINTNNWPAIWGCSSYGTVDLAQLLKCNGGRPICFKLLGYTFVADPSLKHMRIVCALQKKHCWALSARLVDQLMLKPEQTNINMDLQQMISWDPGGN
jgi:hypothetical protein